MSHTTELDRLWSGVDGMFGGHVFSRIADAAVAASDHPLASLSLCFLASVQPGAAAIDVVPVHAGRRTGTCRVQLAQKGRLRVHGVTEHAAGGASRYGRTLDVPPRPAVGHDPPDDMVGLAFRDRLELLLVDEPSLVGSTGGWVRLREEPSTVGLQSAAGVLALLLDVMPPGLFAVRPRPRFVPTLSFSVHFATDVDPDPTAWMYLTHETAWATDSLCVDESTVWSRTGRLLAQGRQTRAVRWPDVG